MLNSTGPGTDPWGTPLNSPLLGEEFPFTIASDKRHPASF